MQLPNGDVMDVYECTFESSILGFSQVQVGDVPVFLEKVKTTIFPMRVQLLDAMNIAGKVHLFFAFLNAQKAWKEGCMISTSLEMETLLYASGTRQIDQAIEMLGVKPSTTTIAAIVFASNTMEVQTGEKRLLALVSGIHNDRVLEITTQGKMKTLMKTFRVTESEIKTVKRQDMTVKDVLTWLIVERVALLSIKH